MTVMFLTMWQYTAGGDEDYERFRPDEFELLDKEQNDGFVQPYSDSPHDTENVSENIYMNIIERAKDYVYITTPYLILDDAMETSLKNAAKAGVDVRLSMRKCLFRTTNLQPWELPTSITEACFCISNAGL